MFSQGNLEPKCSRHQVSCRSGRWMGTVRKETWGGRGGVIPHSLSLGLIFSFKDERPPHEADNTSDVYT